MSSLDEFSWNKLFVILSISITNIRRILNFVLRQNYPFPLAVEKESFWSLQTILKHVLCKQLIFQFMARL